MKSPYRKVFGLIFIVTFLFGFGTSKAQSVLDILKQNSQTSAFASAVERAGIDSRLSSDGPYTLFVPSNKAFNKLSKSERTNSELLLNHIITGTATKRSLQYMSKITGLSGITIEIVKVDNNSLEVQNYPLVENNIRADNGVIHIINGVIQ